MRAINEGRAVATALLLSAAIEAGCPPTALGQSHPAAAPERRVLAESRFAVTNAPRQADLVLLVVDFSPGAWTSLHTHGGQAINLVVEGEITLRRAGMEMPHRAGEAWTDSTGQVHAAGNTGRSKGRLLTNFLLPEGAPQITVIEDSQFEPAIVHEARVPLPTLVVDTDIVQQIAEMSAGWRGARSYEGFVAGLVVEGEITYQIGTERKTYRAGEAWVAQAGTPVLEENRSGSAARVFTTYLGRGGTHP